MEHLKKGREREIIFEIFKFADKFIALFERK